ncbi:SCO5389 family protein [Actinomadura opuntiae]|uniref:SCO5389 family protein n=1 Tax=Actinomadura sp. OS1-43 TaxID=604315 RepID=UPI00255A9F70|nr:SCO5389 family protein [Actinomadura sp. OS1-43]MDL4814992.1 SCO5389 family protein [Actinomadura sp. OS1-43]
MSLTVDDRLLERALRDEVDDASFIACVRESLPYAWEVISGVAARMREGGAGFADNQTPPPDERARGQLLRVLASDAMRGALERHFGVRLAFQNCHRVAAFDLDADGAADRHARFVSPRAQLLNQSPDLVDC